MYNDKNSRKKALTIICFCCICITRIRKRKECGSYIRRNTCLVIWAKMRRDVRARRPEPIVYSWCAMGSHFDFRSASIAIDGKWFNDIPIVPIFGQCDNRSIGWWANAILLPLAASWGWGYWSICYYYLLLLAFLQFPRAFIWNQNWSYYYWVCSDKLDKKWILSFVFKIHQNIYHILITCFSNIWRVCKI